METKLPLIEILNQNLMQDFARINQTSKTRKCDLGDEIIPKLKSDEPISYNFNLLTEYINDQQNQQKRMQDNEEVQHLIHAITIYTNAYVDVNNEIAAVIQNLKESTINDLVTEISHSRYSKIKSLIEKEIYKNDYQPQLINLINKIINSTLAPEIVEFEAQFNHQLATFMMVEVQAKQITPEDDYAIALFSISNGVASRLFQTLFGIIQQNQNNAEKIAAAEGKESEQKTVGKILTKEIPADGPPVDYKPRNSRKN